MNRVVRPAAIAPPAAAYAHGIVTEGPSRFLHTAGVVPVAPDGTVPGDLGAQAEVVWANVAAILTEASMDVGDIVSYTTYVVAGADVAPVMAARDRFMGAHLAASTLVTVPALARPAWLVEVAVIAAAE